MTTTQLTVGAIALALFSLAPASAKEKKKQPRGLIESMQALPCGAKQKGLNGLGAVWGSIGVTSVQSSEKLCPQYLFRTDELEYHIRPEDTKHPVILPIGHEAIFKIKKDRMYLKIADGDGKTRSYQVVAMEPVKSAHAEDSSERGDYREPAPVGRPATAGDVNSANQLPQRAVNQNSVNPLPPQPPN